MQRRPVRRGLVCRHNLAELFVVGRPTSLLLRKIPGAGGVAVAGIGAYFPGDSERGSVGRGMPLIGQSAIGLGDLVVDAMGAEEWKIMAIIFHAGHELDLLLARDAATGGEGLGGDKEGDEGHGVVSLIQHHVP